MLRSTNKLRSAFVTNQRYRRHRTTYRRLFIHGNSLGRDGLFKRRIGCYLKAPLLDGVSSMGRVFDFRGGPNSLPALLRPRYPSAPRGKFILLASMDRPAMETAGSLGLILPFCGIGSLPVPRRFVVGVAFSFRSVGLSGGRSIPSGIIFESGLPSTYHRWFSSKTSPNITLPSSGSECVIDWVISSFHMDSNFSLTSRLIFTRQTI